MKMRSYVGMIGLVLVSTVAACSDDKKEMVAPPPAALTYWQDVAPVMHERCVSCHQAGGIGPFRMDDYQEAKTHAALIAGAVKTRTMPPWLAQGDGACGDFKGSNWLTAQEIELFSKWADSGATEGTPRTDLHPPALGTLDANGEVSSPEFRPMAKGDQTAHADDYRCFIVDPKLDSVKYLTGYEVLPGTPAMIHHVLLMQLDPEKKGMDGRTNAEVIAALHEGASDRDGWPCYGLAGEGTSISGIPVTWAPGMGVVHLPPGVGVPLSPRAMLVMQVHYNLANSDLRGRSDVTKVRLELQPTVERPGFFDNKDRLLESLFTQTPATLEGGKSNVEYTFDFDYDDLMKGLGTPTLDIFGVFPHMHGYGRTQRVQVIRAGASQCAVQVPAWNFNWQLYYFYKQPLQLAPGDKVRVTCGYDTTTSGGPVVLPGWGTSNEMCLLGLFLVPPKAAQ